MSKASIKVQYVNQPKSPKGPGNVKTDEGVYYKVWPKAKGDGATLAQFEEGKTYEVEYDTEQYQGEDKFTIRKILSSSESIVTQSGNGHAPAANGNGRSTDRQILWQVCLKSAAQVFTGTAVEAAAVINLANELYVTEPAEIESVKPESSNQSSEPEVQI